ncbi:glutathione S-transferase family protein [Methylocapsa sp. S129]|uniref:glutathione S-transferase family protein n=1 Tax=Methylocapsa sp. S129 TaxID=1641869 RepID=UPI00131C8EC9|nr:glutathione S-transferase family protein [Methylocapsa sp. S129]
MQLIGMLDSPYVRRVAIALMRLDLPFEHRPISLFRHIDEFKAINPLLKAPTLVADDGTVLMDSTLIIDYAVTLAPDARSLWPRAPKAKLRAARLIGLSLVVCEKAVQFHYERELRPPEKQHEPWAARVRGQLLAGLDALELEINEGRGWLFEDRLTLADITLAAAFAFTQGNLSDIVDKARYGAIASFSARAEELPEFRAAPAEDGATVSLPAR